MIQDSGRVEDNKSDKALLADVGGTNARFAILAGDRLGPVDHVRVADYAQFGDALAGFLSRQMPGEPLCDALLAVAGTVEGDRCVLTNNQWIVDGPELRARFGFADLTILNDFEAVAWSLPHLHKNDLLKLGGNKPKPAAPMLVLGPGTGLGVAVYVPHRQGDLVLCTEGGHGTMPSGSAREDAIIETLRQRFGHVSAERFLSGPGIENLYQAIASLDSLNAPKRSAAEITQAGLAGRCIACRSVIDMFCAMLGETAGNLALATGAQGGVFIGGGIAPHFRGYLQQSKFRARFNAKGRMTSYVSAIPVYLILRDDPALVGLRFLATKSAVISSN
jgi:glucokinase